MPAQAQELESDSSDNPIARKPPIVFAVTGLRPDVQFQVFHQSFHCHSMVLRVHSEFFRKYLKTRDKVSSKTPGSFTYNWVTKIDSDGSWSLVNQDTLQNWSGNDPFPSSTEVQVHAFMTLLQAIYHIPISITSVNHLERTTDLADYYSALPALSHAVTAALFSSPAFIKHIRSRAVDLIETAVKLRNKILFKECLIYLCGPWSNPQYLQVKDRRIRELVEKAHTGILINLGKFQASLFNIAATWGDKAAWERFSTKMMALVPECTGKDPSKKGSVCFLPLYYRKLYDLHGEDGIPHVLSTRLGTLLQNNLVLDRSGVGAGQRDIVRSAVGNEDFFFGAEIDDRDLPWDLKETTW